MSTQVLASRMVTGGMCAAGPCLDELTVTDDGRWVRTTETGQVSSGQLRDPDEKRLRQAALSSEPGSQTPAPRCEGASDGSDVIYSWYRADALVSLSSCDGVTAPVTAVLDRLAEKLR